MDALKSSGWEGGLSHPGGWREHLQDLLCWGDQNILQSLIKGIFTIVIIYLKYLLNFAKRIIFFKLRYSICLYFLITHFY